MTTLMDRNNKPAAYLYNNRILSAGTMEVIGITLGDVVFGYSGSVKGKIFDNCFYATSGDIVSKEEELQNRPDFDPINVLCQGWKILEKIKDHSVSWILPKQQWLPLELTDYLKLNENLALIRHMGKKFSTTQTSF